MALDVEFVARQVLVGVDADGSLFGHRVGEREPARGVPGFIADEAALTSGVLMPQPFRIQGGQAYG